MNSVPEWWQRPRRVAVVTEPDSWMYPACRGFVERLNEQGEAAFLRHDPCTLSDAAVAFYLGCRSLTPQETLARIPRNLVVHASDLPKGRGWSPWVWSILEGANRIPVCLFEAVEALDAGPVIYRESMDLAGHELIDEIREQLADTSIALCQRFLDEPVPPTGVPQSGDPTWWTRRTSADSALDPNRTIEEQFDLLRVCDNERYPAYFELKGQRYRLRIDKIDPAEDDL